MTTFNFASNDGTGIHVHHWSVAQPKAIVQIAHGAAEHAGRYAAVAKALNGAGYEVYANDHRGHGHSALPGKLGVLAKEDGWNRTVSDLAKLNEIIAESHPELPIVLLGHSMSSLMGQQYLVEYGETIAALILSGSTMVEGFAEVLPAVETELAEFGRDAPCKLMGAMMSGGFNIGLDQPKTTHDWLSRDANEVQRYLADPLCGFDMSIGAWLDMMRTSRIPGTVDKLEPAPKQIPLYILSGDRDPVSNQTELLKQLLVLYAAAGMTNVSHRFYEDGRHEMLFETNRDEVTTDLVAWLRESLT